MIVKRLFIVSVFFFLIPFSLKAQTGSVSGKIVNDSNEVIPYQSVWLKGTSYGALSDEKGFFQISNIRSGNYSLICAGLTIDTVTIPVSIKGGENTFVTIKVKESFHELGEVVITATRTEKDIADVPIPVKVISGEQIRQMGSMRLNEVLMEQTGLAIVSDHGTGIQMQGFSSEYTLLLLNGEPLIGRTAGTFDLTRLAVGNIKQIEIVKGPSSSLYGSDALAGVINIITEKPKEKFLANLRTRYGTNNTLGTTADANITIGKLGVYLFADRYSTSGYYLGSSEDKTVPPYRNYTWQTGLSYKFSVRTSLAVTGRFFDQKQYSTYSVSDENSGIFRVGENGTQSDWNINPVLTHYFTEKDRLITRFYSSRFHTYSRMTKIQDGSLYDESFFNQTFNRGETQYNRRWNSKNETVLGAGTILESVNSTRYTSKKYFYSLYAYAQHDITILRKLNIISGLRIDKHSVYGTQINPKFSLKWKFREWFSLRISAGRGFKAPDFRQLYLNWSNPVEGYNVFGSEEMKYQFAQLQQQGQIAQIWIDPYTLKPLKAEHSVAWNAGWISRLSKQITWQVNFFHNDIKDMIATSAVAAKTNGQSVYGYFNLSGVYTEGVETDLSYKIFKNITLTAGYQYLIAKDKQVVKDIQQGQYFTKDPATGITTRLTEKGYGGLFNCSRNMANIRLFYMNPKNGWSFTIRGIYRGRYGFGDVNGNLILDTEEEYVKGYWLWNISVSKKIYKNITLQAGVDNVAGYTRPLYIPSIPGRLFYGSIHIPITKESFKHDSK